MERSTVTHAQPTTATPLAKLTHFLASSNRIPTDLAQAFPGPIGDLYEPQAGQARFRSSTTGNAATHFTRHIQAMQHLHSDMLVHFSTAATEEGFATLAKTSWTTCLAAAYRTGGAGQGKLPNALRLLWARAHRKPNRSHAHHALTQADATAHALAQRLYLVQAWLIALRVAWLTQYQAEHMPAAAACKAIAAILAPDTTWHETEVGIGERWSTVALNSPSSVRSVETLHFDGQHPAAAALLHLAVTRLAAATNAAWLAIELTPNTADCTMPLDDAVSFQYPLTAADTETMRRISQATPVDSKTGTPFILGSLSGRCWVQRQDTPTTTRRLLLRLSPRPGVFNNVA